MPLLQIEPHLARSAEYTSGGMMDARPLYILVRLPMLIIPDLRRLVQSADSSVAYRVRKFCQKAVSPFCGFVPTTNPLTDVSMV